MATPIVDWLGNRSQKAALLIRCFKKVAPPHKAVVALLGDHVGCSPRAITDVPMLNDRLGGRYLNPKACKGGRLCGNHSHFDWFFSRPAAPIIPPRDLKVVTGLC